MSEFEIPSGPGRAERIALRVLQLGAIAIVLAASLDRTFELDRFNVPKELVLHAATVMAGLFGLRALRRVRMTWIDALLCGFLALSAVSAIFATNPWLALRALAVSASGAALFWIARGLKDAGLAQRLLHALALAVVLAAATALLQAYGVRLDLFSLNRAPGGTLGNRNSIGHVAAFGLPLVIFVAMRKRVAFFGVAIVAAALVLTRSRAAWIAAAAAVGIVFLAFLFSRALRPRVGRLLLILLFGAGGAVAAMLIPNTLRWRSDNPYLESVRSVAEYGEGSGRGRLVHYQRSLTMAVAHPLFGVGPGNWPVVYPKFAARNDPSLNGNEPGMTFNPWPSSDWIAVISERGFLAFLTIALFFAAIVFRRGSDPLEQTTLIATVIGASLAGAFDAVLLLGLPAYVVWLALGSLSPVAAEGRTLPRMVSVLVLVIAAAGLARSTAQLVAMQLYPDAPRLAARVDPGNFRIRMRLARSGKRKERCAHARAARALFPTSQAARSLARNCE